MPPVCVRMEKLTLFCHFSNIGKKLYYLGQVCWVFEVAVDFHHFPTMQCTKATEESLTHGAICGEVVPERSRKKMTQKRIAKYINIFDHCYGEIQQIP